MKPFNLELAKQGHPVCTREGIPVRIICWDRKRTDYPIMALIDFPDTSEEECLETYTLEGKLFAEGKGSMDLYMASVKHTGYINIYKDGNNRFTSNIYKTEEEAICRRVSDCVTTIKIEWEE